MKTSVEKSSTVNAPAKEQDPLLGKKNAATPFFTAAGVQAKMTVNTPGDTFEQEANATADKVMQMPVAPVRKENTPDIQRECTDCEQETPVTDTVQRKETEVPPEIQRECADCEQETPAVQRKETEVPSDIQRECADCEQETPVADTIQRTEAASSGGGSSAPPVVSQVVSESGTPMDRGTRGFMEQRFGSDFSGVRVHTDAKAAHSARAISAHAYTYRNHIVFDQGQYNPHSNHGRHLLAHELTHVVQQNGQVQRRENPNARPPAPNGGTTTAPPPANRTNGAPAAAPPAGTPAVVPGTVPPAANGAAAPPPAAPAVPGVVLNREPLVPEAPADLTPAARQRLQQAQNNAGRAGTAANNLPTEADSTAEARGAVTEPTEETDARASGALAAELGTRPAPSPEIEELCENIRRVIREQRPPDEDSLLQADPEAAANEAGSQLNDNVNSDADRVGGEYDALDNDPAGTPEQIGEAPAAVPEDVAAGAINADRATPDPLAPEEVSLDNDVANTAKSMTAAGMDTEPAQLVQDGPIAEARAAHGELDTAAQTDPAEVLAQQDAALGTARGDMEALQAQALQALQQSRTRTIAGSSTQQTGMTGSEEQMRAELGRQAEEIFTNAQTQVNTLLEPLTRTAMEMWETGKTRLATEFEQHLAEVQSWVDERHEGVGGAIVGAWDALTGLPGWVTEEYNDAEQTFGDGVCALIREISTYVNGIIATCETLIDQANTEITTLFANAPGDLATWAAAEQEQFRQRLEGMRANVLETQQNFNRELTTSAAQAVQEVRQQVHELREKAKGLIGRIADAIGEFLDDPLRFIINGLLSLVGIEPSRFWALVDRIAQVIGEIAADPLGFASKLLSAIGAGFQRFFDNIGTHLFNGMINWLLSGLGSVGVQIPTDFSISSVITFFLQLMGITWDRVRMLLARHIGEENVALIEQAYTLVADLIEMGPEGIFQLIEDQLDPQHILDTIIQMAIDFLRDALITQITARILLLFNPVGAIAQAIEAIFRVLQWIFENASRIFTLVETVVNGIADILAGNISGMAQAVETALAGLLTPVIDFLASYAGLGNLPERIADAVRGMQEWVEGILDRVIGFLARQARAVLSSLGIGERGGEAGEAGGNEEGDYDGELGKTVNWSAEGESHRIWINATGAHPRVMMASEPRPITNYLDDYAQMANEKFADQPNEKQETLNLVSTARTDAALISDKAEEIKTLQQDSNTENDASVDNKDDLLEQQMETIGPKMRAIREKLGLKSIKEEFAAEFDKMHISAKEYCFRKLDENPNDAVQHATSWGPVKSWLERNGMIFLQPMSQTTVFVDKVTQPKAQHAAQQAIDNENVAANNTSEGTVEDNRSRVNAGSGGIFLDAKNALITFGFEFNRDPFNALVNFYRQRVGLDDETRAIINTLNTINKPGIDKLIRDLANKNYGDSQHNGYKRHAERAIQYHEQGLLVSVEYEAGGGRADIELLANGLEGVTDGTRVLVEVKNWPDFQNLPQAMRDERLVRLARQLTKFLSTGAPVILEWAGTVPTEVRNAVPGGVTIQSI